VKRRGIPQDELVKLVKSLSAKMEKLEEDRACFSYEEMQRIFWSLKRMLLAALLMMKK
jgi:hypothetical protein